MSKYEQFEKHLQALSDRFLDENEARFRELRDAPDLSLDEGIEFASLQGKFQVWMEIVNAACMLQLDNPDVT